MKSLSAILCAFDMGLAAERRLVLLGDSVEGKLFGDVRSLIEIMASSRSEGHYFPPALP